MGRTILAKPLPPQIMHFFMIPALFSGYFIEKLVEVLGAYFSGRIV
jgi:hypothetical protein